MRCSPPLQLKTGRGREPPRRWRRERTDARGSGQGRCRASELALVVLFLLVIASVPVGQTCLELARGERVQFTDVFRYRPTAQNLRQYKATLKEKSWFQQTLRPLVQRLLFMTLPTPAPRACSGAASGCSIGRTCVTWWSPIGPTGRHPGSKWVPTDDGRPERESVVHAIVRFRDQLKERGIALLVVPVPGKPSVYPGQLTSRSGRRGCCVAFTHPEVDRMLQSDQVRSWICFPSSPKIQRKGPIRFIWRGTHTGRLRGSGWRRARWPRGCGRLGLAPPPSRQFRTQTVDVQRWGDVLEMMQIPGLRRVFPAQTVRCEQVVDPGVGLLVPTSSDRPGAYRFPGQKASILVLGDSFLRIYQFPEPRSLGELPRGTSPADAQDANTKKLLPGSAGFVSQLALLLQAPVDAIYSDGGASTDVRRKLSTNPEILEGKKVVIWEFVERDIALGREGWEEMPLPAKLD